VRAARLEAANCRESRLNTLGVDLKTCRDVDNTFEDVGSSVGVDSNTFEDVDSMVEVVPNMCADNLNTLGVDLKRRGVVDNTFEVVGSTVGVDSNSFEVVDSMVEVDDKISKFARFCPSHPSCFWRFVRYMGRGRSDEFYRLRT